MAEYKPLARHTFKFVRESIFETVGDLSAAAAPMCGKAKVIVNNELMYYPITPNSGTSAAGFSIAVADQAIGANTGSTFYPAQHAHEYIPANARLGSCIVDGKVYYGVKTAQFFLFSYSDYSTAGSGELSTKGFVVPGGKCKVIKYLSAQKTIGADEYQINKKNGTGKTATGAKPYAYQYVRITIPKENDDLILGIEMEYPKYDITINGAVDGLQYSVDDGATFQDVPGTLALEQVEHIVFKNTGDIPKTIGTSSGGSDVGTVSAGATLTAVPEASGTWYIG